MKECSNLYCGIIVLILIPALFLCRSIKLKEKLMHLALLSALILSFNLNVLDFIWHGFHYPNQVPYRFSFVYIFLVLSISYEACKRIHEFTGKQVGMISMCIFGIIVVSRKFNSPSIEYTTLYSSMIAVALHAVALTIDKSCKTRNPILLKSLTIFLVIIAEITANTIITTINIDIIEGYSSREGYSSGKEVAEIRKWVSDIKKEDEGFYRMEIIPPKTTNDPFLYNYQGLSIFVHFTGEDSQNV